MKWIKFGARLGAAPAREHMKCWIAVALWVILLLLAFSIWCSGDGVPVAKPDQALEAIKLLKDWTSWMAGVQTATLAALGILAKDGVLNVQLTERQTSYLIGTVVFAVFALFFSAWLLTATSSLALRVPGCTCTVCSDGRILDFYNYPLYDIFPRHLTVAFFVACNHWLWAASIVCFGMLALTVITERGPVVRSSVAK